MRHNGTRLDTDALRVLNALSKQDDYRLNTSEAKTILGEDNNDIVRRRMLKLEEAGLADLDEDEGFPAPINPKRATLTEEGVAKADEWDLNPKTGDVRDTKQRLERLENRMDNIMERLDDLEEAAFENDDQIPPLEEVRRLQLTVNQYLIEEQDADLGKHYPTQKCD